MNTMVTKRMQDLYKRRKWEGNNPKTEDGILNVATKSIIIITYNNNASELMEWVYPQNNCL